MVYIMAKATLRGKRKLDSLEEDLRLHLVVVTPVQ
jgi:hypothetical protein